MSIQDDSPSQGPDDPPRFCTKCGATLATTDRFCPECGADIARQQAQHAAATAEDASEPEIAPVQIPESGQQVSRRKRRRRPWFRRPLFVIPIALVVVLLTVGGVMAYRTYRAFGEVNEVSTPPPEISGVALGGDEDVTIDTGPAQRAVAEWEATQAAEANSGNDGESNANPTATDPAQTASSNLPTEEPPATTPSESTSAPTRNTGDEPDVIGPTGSGSSRATEPAGATEPTTETAAATDQPTEPAGAADRQSPGADVSTGVNILLMGVDSREGEAIDIGVRPDSIGILNLNEETGTCRILAIPRDSRVEIPGYGESKVNHALAVGGIPFEMLVVEHYLGITIDHYALVDFSGLVAVVDAFGGVTVDNPEAFEMSGHTFEAGEIHLDGEEALLYSRYRGGSDGDFGRVEKQQQVIKALLDEATERNLVNLVPEMWKLLQDHFRTDYGMFDLLDVANEFRGDCTSATLETETIPGGVETLPDAMMGMDLSFVVSDPEEVDAMVQWLLTGDPANEESGGSDATPAATPEASGTVLIAWRHDQGW